MFLGAARKAAIAWSDAMLDLDQRWLQARKRIFAPDVTYGTDDLVQDTLATWLLGMRTWERVWNAAYGSAQTGVPVIMIRNPGLVGEATIATSDGEATLQTTDLAHLGSGRAIPRADVTATVDGNGVLTVKIRPRAKEDRDLGLYRGVVFTETAGTPRVVADLVVELSPVA
jgi:hypothetical protein